MIHRVDTFRGRTFDLLYPRYLDLDFQGYMISLGNQSLMYHSFRGPTLHDDLMHMENLFCFLSSTMHVIFPLGFPTKGFRTQMLLLKAVSAMAGEGTEAMATGNKVATVDRTWMGEEEERKGLAMRLGRL
ncbi:hypothetical protein B296_00017956 [Ensete ventricosum]|uniref:Uncharacterized protein n=1 Tax=Ensete ventricosum TaxID=4639 RepID=A0A426XMK6_ENSVE|nr:hypothetical protein B296_00017956 [Ensete ventricosum]